MNPYDPAGAEPWQVKRGPGQIDPDFALELTNPASLHGANGRLGMSVLDGGRVFKRRAIKQHKRRQWAMVREKERLVERVLDPTQVTWLVAELDGVYCYATTSDGGQHHIVLTKDGNLTP